ncbi:MAG: CheA signal transduction histidine kinase [Acidobacteriales bacterium]|nr:CheA signal transduction histidine kinase [Terriglobales bacterium]
MSFFSEERASELKDLFFESATELLQALNEEGLDLEKHPGDPEVVRQVRRTVHTLKGDSAACGYTELSALAHELEDALTPELAKQHGVKVAEVVLSAADTFQNMLNAYRANTPAPTGDRVFAAIHALIRKPALVPSPNAVSGIVTESAPAKPRFEWSEYEKMVMTDAVSRGLKVLQLALTIDPNCVVRVVALQMIKTAFSDLGTVLVVVPEEGSPLDKVEVITAALASSFDEEYIARKCKIPAVISEVFVERYTAPAAEAASTNGAGGAQHAEEDALNLAPEQNVPHQEPISEADSFSTSSLSTAPESTLRVDAERIDAVLNLVGELIIGKSMLTQTINEFDKKFAKDPLRAKFADALAYQARVLTDLQKSVMKVRMVPVEQLFRRFPRVVRDVSKACGKEVHLEVHGQATDLDKSILDVLAEPMAHLVRNAIGHGIESPEERLAAGKLKIGTIKLDAYHQGNNIVIEVSDDGRGIDRQKVLAKAIERGIVTQEETARMTDGEALNLIFHPGLSTAEEITSVSGRGVGMDIVKSVLERLKGSVVIDSKVGQGSTFYLKVPLTLAIIKALMFRVVDRMYAVPLGSVMEITRAMETEIHRVDQHEVIKLRDQVLTLVRLNRLANSTSKQKKIFIVVIAVNDRKFGLVVDKLIGEEELVIKALDDHLVATELVSGASILGDGTVVLILNVNSVVARLGRSNISDDLRAGASA